MEEDKPQILLWTVPECPFRVTVLASVLNEIRVLAVEAFYSVPRGGVEIGGVFFGVHEGGSIHIRAHRQIHCEYSTGPSFTLSVKDQLGLSGLLDQAPSDPELSGMKPLGWYHSHTRSELFLSPVDVQLYTDFFHERWQIAAVLRPANLHPTRAGFFFRDKLGNLKSDSPVREFKLEPPGFGLAILDPNDLDVILRAAPVAEPSAPVPAAPSIKPAPAIAARARATTPNDTPKPLPEPVSTVLAAVAAGNARSLPATPDNKSPEKAPEPALEPPERKPLEIGLHSFDVAESAARGQRKSSWVWALVIIILLGAGGITAFLKWGRIAKPGGLGLETYDINGAFLIRWDRTSSAITGARHATLDIDDGGEKISPIDLGPGELAAGGYGYMRRTPQVSVHMTIDGPTPVDEYSNFRGVPVVASRSTETPEQPNGSNKTQQEKEHLKTELINESMQTIELRREINSLRRQLAEERARNVNPDPLR